ncbi:hypothetical protein GCM10010385_40340 [Streptomyces geysiriensis]|nr:hypothetical protein GCM10010385_40340 [Streptomyces geysiriensis]
MATAASTAYGFVVRSRATRGASGDRAGMGGSSGQGPSQYHEPRGAVSSPVRGISGPGRPVRAGCRPRARDIPRPAGRTAWTSVGTCTPAQGTTTETAAVTVPSGRGGGGGVPGRGYGSGGPRNGGGAVGRVPGRTCHDRRRTEGAAGDGRIRA